MSEVIYILDEAWKRNQEELDQAMDQLFDEKEHAMSNIRKRHKMLNELIHQERKRQDRYESENKEKLDEIDRRLNELLND